MADIYPDIDTYPIAQDDSSYNDDEANLDTQTGGVFPP